MRILLRHQLLWALLFAPVAFLLGYWGHRSLDFVDMGRTDAIFASVQLFVLGAELYPGETPWTLDIARFLAPLSLIYATAALVLTLMRDHFQRVLVARRAHDHTVLIGLGSANNALAQSMTEGERRVVAVESDPTNQSIPGLRDLGIAVLVGDARQASILSDAGVPRARHVVIATGDDSRNIEIADQARRLAEGGQHLTLISTDIQDETLWTRLGTLRLTPERQNVVVEFYSRIDRLAQALVRQVEADAGPQAIDQVHLEGRGSVARRVVVHLARRAQLEGSRAAISVSQQTVDEVLPELSTRDSWLMSACDFSIVSDASESDATTAIVCSTDSDAWALAVGLELQEHRQFSSVFANLHGEISAGLLELVGVDDRLRLISASTEARRHEEFLGASGIELMARARHESYVASEQARGLGPEQNPSLVPWAQLPESLRDSNRHFARAVGEVISSLGGRLVPLRTPEIPSLPDDGGLLEQLARNEHDRWMADLQLAGWSYSPGPKDAHAKTHPLLVPWGELDESEREKDRDGIRAIPGMLARAGYALEIPAEAHTMPVLD